MSKVLFLDIDGVLTSARAHVAFQPEKIRRLVWHHFDPVAIGFLNRLSEEVKDLEFVLSSTWRKLYSQKDMTMMLSMQGWQGQWHQNWITPILHKDRGTEINAWIEEHKPESFVILDDDPAAGGLLKLQRHFVQTSEMDGMNSLEHFNRAKDILKIKVK